MNSWKWLGATLISLTTTLVTGCGSPIGAYRAGQDWEEEGNLLLALESHERSANLGHFPAYMDLGRIYAEGTGYIPADPARAFAWYSKAAEQGYAPAQSTLAEIYAEGNGVPQDYSAAITWYTKAAEQGGAGTQYVLAEIYHNGEMTEQDDSVAIKWYQRAAEQGHEPARQRLSELYQITLPAADVYTEDAEKGDAYGQYHLANRYRKGDGVPQNHDLSMQWYLKSAEQGFAPAQYALGYLSTNPTETVKWYTNAAEQGFIPAMRALGYCYFEGFGIRSDYVMSYKWLNLASANDSEAAEVKDNLVGLMTTAEVLEGQRLSSEFLKAQSFSPTDLDIRSRLYLSDISEFGPPRPPKPNFEPSHEVNAGQQDSLTNEIGAVLEEPAVVEPKLGSSGLRIHLT